jgi:hypothetical protein
MDRVCSRKTENRNLHRLLVDKPEGNRPVRKTRSRGVCNIERDLRRDAAK